MKKTIFNRRDFLSLTASALAGMGALGPVTVLARQSRKLDILMLGGTDFLGPSVVTELLERGHNLTLFNRGVSNPHLFPGLEKIRGNRELADGSGIAKLKNRHWDVVIDTWQKAPRCVRDTAQLLRGMVGQYQYVSSIAVYKDWSSEGIDEHAELNDVPEMPEEYEVGIRYSIRKTLAEMALMETLPDVHTIFRSHGMRGVRIPDPTDEPYWPVRIARGGEVLAPDSGITPIQFTDIVSLCRFMGHAAESGKFGAFNVLSKRGSCSLSAYLEKCRAVTASDGQFTWIPAAFLEIHDIKPYRNLPMWRPEPAGFYNFSAEKALNAGLENRPVKSTIADMMTGYKKRHPDDDFQFGLEPNHGTISMDVERDVLKAWHEEVK
jgi:2'-hydroxyisoflavone reductase